MQQPMQPIIQHLFQVSSLEDVSRQRLEAFVEEYPSFGIGHYLLSRKLKAEGSERFTEETRKTGLYFTNPFWLQWQLEHIPVAETTFELAAGDDLAEALGNSKEEELTIEEEESMTAGEGEAIEGEPVQAISTTEERHELSAAERLLRSIEEARDLRESLHKINNVFEAETAVAGEVLPAEAEEPVETVQEPVKEVEEPIKIEESVKVEESIVEESVEVEGSMKVDHPIKDEEAPFVLDEPEAPEPPLPVAESVPVVETAPAAIAPPAAEPALVFEPYHTIDYFASQGIKLTLDENPSDPLGKQVKSFTDWLKHMKRLPQKDREVVPDRVAEQAVQTIAAHSIEGKDVLTETMAEVLAKQGMREKARVVYEKLSLLNPDKRAYFASKIEQLNIS